MKIIPSTIEKFIKSFNKDLIKAILVYGPDTGLVKLKSKEIALRIVNDLRDPFNVIEFEYDKIKDDSRSLADGLYSLSLIGGKKLIIIDMGTSTSLSPNHIEIIKQNSWDNFLLIIGSELGPSSNIRIMCEQVENLASIACYQDEGEELKNVIKKSLERYELEEGVIEFLQYNISGDRALILSELNKLKLYKNTDKYISLEDVENVISHSVEMEIREFEHNLAGKNLRESIRTLDLLFQEGKNFVYIIRALLKYFVNLYQAKLAIKQGKLESEAINEIKPAIFFKNKPIFTKHLKMWDIDKLSLILHDLNQTEANSKKTGSNPKQLLEKLILDFCK